MKMGSMLLKTEKKGGVCYKVAKNLAELCLSSSVLWKVELVSNQIGYLTGKIFKQKC